MQGASKKVIISIDGGGIRGIIPLVILRKIFEPITKINTNFSVEWWGTSAGALISSSIAFNTSQKVTYAMACQQTLDFFEFRSESMLENSKQSLSNRPFKTLLSGIFGDVKLESLRSVNIIATETPSFSAQIFNGSTNENLVDALRASCAVPGIFPAIEINGKLYVDGFIAAKNPTQLALENTKIEKPDLVLSLGTGLLRSTDAIEKSVLKVEAEAESFCKTSNIKYHRLNPKLAHSSDSMENITPKNIFNLKRDAYDFLENQEKAILEIQQILSY